MPINLRFEFPDTLGRYRGRYYEVLAFPWMHFGYPISPDIKDNIEKINPWEERLRETELFSKGVKKLKASIDETNGLKLRKCLGLIEEDVELKNSFGSK